MLGFGSRFRRRRTAIERHFLLEDPMLLVLPREHPLAEQAQPAPGRPRRRGVDRRPAGLRVQPPDLRRLLGRGLRPADRVRDRRLRRRPGLRRRGRRRLADRRARPDDDPRRHRRARPRARDAGAQDLRGDLPAATGRPPRRRCSRCCRPSPRATRRAARGSSSSASSPPSACAFGRAGAARLARRLAALPSTASVSSSSAPASRSISVHTSSTWSRSATIPKSRWSR